MIENLTLQQFAYIFWLFIKDFSLFYSAPAYFVARIENILDETYLIQTEMSFFVDNRRAIENKCALLMALWAE